MSILMFRKICDHPFPKICGLPKEAIYRSSHALRPNGEQLVRLPRRGGGHGVNQRTRLRWSKLAKIFHRARACKGPGCRRQDEGR